MVDAALRMDRQYRWQRHIYDLTRLPYLLGRDRLIAELSPPTAARILEIGCGTGRNLIRIARTYPGLECFGIDVSNVMLATARRSIASAGLQGRIRLAQADAVTVDPARLFGVESFDRVVISYALSMIPPWRQVLAHSASSARSARFAVPGRLRRSGPDAGLVPGVVVSLARLVPRQRAHRPETGAGAAGGGVRSEIAGARSLSGVRLLGTIEAPSELHDVRAPPHDRALRSCHGIKIPPFWPERTPNL